MNRTFTSRTTTLALLAAITLCASFGAQAQDRRGGHEQQGGAREQGPRVEGRGGREAGPRVEHPGGREQAPRVERRVSNDVYRSRNLVYDDRYRHGHYYPAPGYSVGALPSGHIGITFGNGRFYFHGGAWYRPGPAGFVVVRPPLGITLPFLPFGYTSIWVGGIPYYYANDVYYTGSPGNYVVVEAPAVVSVTPTPAAAPAPAPAPAPAASGAPPQAPGTWYYCDSAKLYYPYVAECKEGWRAVPATPPATQ